MIKFPGRFESIFGLELFDSTLYLSPRAGDIGVCGHVLCDKGQGHLSPLSFVPATPARKVAILDEIFLQQPTTILLTSYTITTTTGIDNTIF